MEGHLIQIVAAMFDTLPTSVLLGTDIGELGELLGTKIVAGSTKSLSGQQVLVATMRARAEKVRKEKQERAKEQTSGVTPKPVETSSTNTEKEVWNLGHKLRVSIQRGPLQNEADQTTKAPGKERIPRQGRGGD